MGKIKIKMVPGGPAGFALRRLATLGGAGRSFARLRKPIGTATSRLFSTTLRRKGGGEDIMRYRDYAPVNEGALTTRYSEFIMFFAYCGSSTISSMTLLTCTVTECRTP